MLKMRQRLQFAGELEKPSIPLTKTDGQGSFYCICNTVSAVISRRGLSLQSLYLSNGRVI